MKRKTSKIQKLKKTNNINKKKLLKIGHKNRRYYFKKAFLRALYFDIFLVVLVVVLCSRCFFKLENIEYKNNSTYENSDISVILRDCHRKSLLLCNLNKIRKNICENFPEIDNIKFEKKLPDTLILELNAAEYEYCLEEDNVFFVVSKNGKIVKKSDVAPENLFKIYNSELKSYQVCEKAEFENAEHQIIVEKILSCAKKYKIENLTSVDLSDTQKISVKLNDSLEIKLGNLNNFDEKFSNLVNILDYKVSKYARGCLDLSQNRDENHVYFDEAR